MTTAAATPSTTSAVAAATTVAANAGASPSSGKRRTKPSPDHTDRKKRARGGTDRKKRAGAVELPKPTVALIGGNNMPYLDYELMKEWSLSRGAKLADIYETFEKILKTIHVDEDMENELADLHDDMHVLISDFENLGGLSQG